MIKYKKDTDRIVTLTLNMEGRAANIINHELSDALVPVIEHLQAEKAKGSLQGIIITSAKKGFLQGGDLEYLFKAKKASAIFELAERFKAVLRSLERPGVPVVAAINGNALGAGFELALACHYRIALDLDHLRVGFPETQLGVIPSGGGITRLMWLLGIAQAYEVLSSGQLYNTSEALQRQLIDDTASTAREMMDKAKAFILGTKQGCRPWDQGHSQIPAGTARELAVAERLRALTASLAAHGPDTYPAEQAILSVLYEGSKLDFDTSCRVESRHFTRLLRSQVSKNRIKAFWFDQNFIREGGNRPKGFGKFRPKKVGIIGAGRMGSGIAYVCLDHGMKVVLKDVSKPIAERGLEYVRRYLDEDVSKAVKQAEERERLLKRIQTTESSADFQECDIVIEAVFENRMVKQKVMREAEEHTDEYSLFGSNTVSIPITRLAEASLRPENYWGCIFSRRQRKSPWLKLYGGLILLTKQ